MEKFNGDELLQKLAIVDGVVREISYAERNNILFVLNEYFFKKSVLNEGIQINGYAPSYKMIEASTLNVPFTFVVPNNIKKIVKKMSQLPQSKVSDWMDAMQPIIDETWHLLTADEKNLTFAQPGEYSILYEMTKDDAIMKHTKEPRISKRANAFCDECCDMEFSNLYISNLLHVDSQCWYINCDQSDCDCFGQCLCTDNIANLADFDELKQ